MRFTTLDRIVRSQLLQSGYSIHWYTQFLKFAADGLRELTFDSLRIINTEKLPVNSYKAVTLPCSFVDWISVGLQQGQYVQPLVTSPSINRLYDYGTNGDKIPYPDVFQDDAKNGNINGIGFLGYNWVTWNEYNEPIGRLFGLGNFPGANGFIVLPERGEIQLDNASCAKWIILEYISDGQDCNSATRIDPYAQKTIETYIIWMMKENGRQYSMGERQTARQEFLNQQRILRARKDDLTLTDIKNISRKNANAAIKS